MNFLANLAQSAGYAIIADRDKKESDAAIANKQQDLLVKQQQVEQYKQQTKAAQDKQAMLKAMQSQTDSQIAVKSPTEKEQYYSNLAERYALAGLTDEANAFRNLATEARREGTDARKAAADAKVEKANAVSEAAFNLKLNPTPENQANLVAKAQEAGVQGIPLVTDKNFKLWAQGMEQFGMTAKDKAKLAEQEAEAKQRALKDKAAQDELKRHHRTMEQQAAQTQANLKSYREDMLELKKEEQARKNKLAEIAASKSTSNSKDDQRFGSGIRAAASVAMHVDTLLESMVGAGTLSNLKDKGDVTTAFKSLAGRTLTTDQEKAVKVTMDGMSKTLANAITSLENVPRGYTQAQVDKLTSMIEYKEGDSAAIRIFKLAMVSEELRTIMAVSTTKNPELKAQAETVRESLNLGFTPAQVMAYIRENDPKQTEAALSTYRSTRDAANALRLKIDEAKVKGLSADGEVKPPSSKTPPALPPGFSLDK